VKSIHRMKISEFLKLKDFSFLKNKNTSDSEYRSWQNSLPYLQKALKGLEEYEIILEYPVFNSPMRIDAVIIGENIVFIELKQWSENNCRILKKKLIEVLGEKRLNPALQVEGYKKHFQLFSDLKKEIKTVVFLHNFKGKIDEFNSKIFYKNEYDKLNYFLKTNLGKPDNSFEFNIKPSKELIEAIKNYQNLHQEFVLSPKQREIMLSILNSKNRVILVKGTPGSGKSLLALNLHFYFLKKRYSSLYLTKNATPKEVYSYIIGDKKSNLGFASVKGLDKSGYLIIDEAHRLPKNSLEDILKKPFDKIILFFDEKQIVSCDDIGEEIYRYAEETYKIDEQFRCDYSIDYLKWIDSILYEEEFSGEFKYKFEICENIDEFADKCNRFNARMVAGYCWDWKSKTDKNAYDIEIGKHRWQWNEYGENQFIWPVDKKQSNKIGCIHTSQGMEFDYVGVIVAEDLCVKNGKICTNPYIRSRDDFTIFKNGKLKCKNIDKIIKNTYRVLLTRAKKGTFVYFMNEELKEFFKRKLSDSLSKH